MTIALTVTGVILYYVLTRLLMIVDHVLIENEDPRKVDDFYDGKPLVWFCIPLVGDIIFILKILVNISYAFGATVPYLQKIQKEMALKAQLKEQERQAKVRIAEKQSKILVLQEQEIEAQLDRELHELQARRGASCYS